MATTFNRITDVLECLAEHQGPELVNQSRNQENLNPERQKIGLRALERFLKFASPKFHGGSDPRAAENCFERMVEIFATLDYAEERQVNFAVFQFERVARSWWNIVRTKWKRKQTP